MPKVSKSLKAVGVTEIKQNGNKMEIYMEPDKAPKAIKEKLASQGYVLTQAATSYNNAPYQASYFEGAGSLGNTATIHQKISLADQYFKSDPLAGPTIELAAIIAIEGFRNECPDKKIKKWFDTWNESVDWETVLGWISLDYFKTGNVTTLRRLVPIESVIHNMDVTSAAKKIMYTKKMIPGVYTVLNPLTVQAGEVNGYQEALYFSTKDLKVDPLFSNDPTEILIRELPEELLSKVKNKLKGLDKIPLVSKNIKRILRMRMPYEPYGHVLMERAFAALHEKNKLRQMDMSMTNSVMNQIIKVTIGNDQFPAGPAQLNKITKMLLNVSKSQTIVWNHTLQIEVIRPDIKVLEYSKYERVNEDIRNAFGISEVLSGSGKGTYSNGMISLKRFITNLIEARRNIAKWISSEYADIAEAMEFDTYPKPVFNPLSLTDEIAEKQIIQGLVDRGVISYESAQIRLGYNPVIEEENMKREKPLKDDGILGLTAIPGQQPKDEGGNKSSKIKGAEGRPKTPEGKKILNKKTSVKGQASFDEDEQTREDILEEKIKENSELEKDVVTAVIDKYSRK